MSLDNSRDRKNSLGYIYVYFSFYSKVHVYENY